MLLLTFCLDTFLIYGCVHFFNSILFGLFLIQILTTLTDRTSILWHTVLIIHLGILGFVQTCSGQSDDTRMMLNARIKALKVNYKDSIRK